VFVVVCLYVCMFVCLYVFVVWCHMVSYLVVHQHMYQYCRCSALFFVCSPSLRNCAVLRIVSPFLPPYLARRPGSFRWWAPRRSWPPSPVSSSSTPRYSDTCMLDVIRYEGFCALKAHRGKKFNCVRYETQLSCLECIFRCNQATCLNFPFH